MLILKRVGILLMLIVKTVEIFINADTKKI